MDEKLKEQVGRGLAKIPSGCAVLTAGDEKSGTAILASWYQQCSFEPPMVCVVVHKGRPIEAVIDQTGKFVLNLIGDNYGQMFRHFARGFKPGKPVFEGLSTQADAHGVVLTDCIGWLACKVVGKHATGDHHLYIGEVAAAETGKEAKPYVHARKTGFDY